MKTLLLTAALVGGLFSFSHADPISVGSASPSLTAPNDEGKTTNLGELVKKGPVLVYFYPKADTPGCTAQACNLRDHFEDLGKAGVTVVGVSTDGVVKQAAFKAKYKLPFTLLADEKGLVAKAFGVPVTLGYASRQSFLLKDGKVIWRDLSATPKTQSEDALKALAASVAAKPETPSK